MNNPAQAFNVEKKINLLLTVFFFTYPDPPQRNQSTRKSLKGKLQKTRFIISYLKKIYINSILLTSGGQLSGFIVIPNIRFLDEHEPPTSDKIQNNTNKTSLKRRICIL